MLSLIENYYLYIEHNCKTTAAPVENGEGKLVTLLSLTEKSEDERKEREKKIEKEELLRRRNRILGESNKLVEIYEVDKITRHKTLIVRLSSSPSTFAYETFSPISLAPAEFPHAISPRI